MITGKLPWKDSNSHKRNQNPVCYHYTTRQENLKMCCLGKTRTLTNGTRIRCATITPQGNSRKGFKEGESLTFDSANLNHFFNSTKTVPKNYQISATTGFKSS